jgi:hypothetical protein
MQDAVFWSEYGCPFDARRLLPAREYQAHLAILAGRARKVKDDAEKQRGRSRR